MVLEIETFIQRCQISSSEAYAAFKDVLVLLESDKNRGAAVCFLHQLTRHYQVSQPSKCHFHFLEQNILDKHDQSLTLKLLQFPSTFLPEAWSFTFYEGLIRYPQSEYHSRKVVELGCGIGWITIALACRYGPEKIYGVDINPKAIICARLNLYLNAFDQQGDPILYFNDRSLLECVEFHESNLFSYFNGQSIELDKIIGCIPQVLNPEPEVMEDLIAESASDEYLYSLSNYFAKQGFIEDQFGLGLIASAVEQSISLLKSNGKLILNLGGRPGRAVLERLMRRRGFKVRRVWQTQVEQAADTEINALVDIEKTTGHRFEFYMSENSEVSIDARTAAQYAEAGGKIFHSVDVYEAEMVFPEKVKCIFNAIKSAKQDSIRSALDLTFDSFPDAEERYSFLAFLAGQLQKVTNYPYDETSGLTYFRQQLAEYFRYYLRVDISEEQVMITPGRRELITSLLINFRPQKAIVCKSLSGLVERQSLFDVEIVEAPEQVEFLTELMRGLKPKLVITRLDPHELQSSQLVEQLIAMAESINAILVIDLTDSIDLSSQPQIHGVYRYLSSHHISNNLVLMAALVNNHVYQNYSLNITLTNNEFISKSLIDAAELTYSRTPLLKQLYYAHLLEELLFFQRTRSTSIMSKRVKSLAPALPISLSDETQQAFNHPAIKGNHLSFNKNTVRLDFGENELAAPQLFNVFLFESYLVRKCIGDEGNPNQAIFEQLHQRF
ncbi:MAG: methyltransferase, partial [Kangiellaceae bacterium]|nr:methyltransferase [Kangiellaceae bacterium]